MIVQLARRALPGPGPHGYRRLPVRRVVRRRWFPRDLDRTMNAMTRDASNLLLLLVMLILPPRARAQGPAPLRLGIVGLTHSHVHGLLGRKNRGDVVIVGIAEPNRELARRYAQRYGLSLDLVFDSVNEMLDKTRPAAVAAFGSTFDH